MKTEYWKPIDESGIYLISNLARFGSKRRGPRRLLKPFKSRNKEAYFQVSASHGGRVTRYYLHRLIAEVFVPNPLNKKEVNHINGIKTDNRIENLEWCTHQENMAHAMRTGLSTNKGQTAPRSKLKQKEVDRIRVLHSEGHFFQKELAQMFGVSVPTISGIVNNKNWICK